MTKNLQDLRAEAREILGDMQFDSHNQIHDLRDNKDTSAEIEKRMDTSMKFRGAKLNTLIDSVLDRVEDCVPRCGITKATAEWYTEMVTLLKRNGATSLIPEKARHFVLTQVLMEARSSTCEEFLTNLSTLRS